MSDLWIAICDWFWDIGVYALFITVAAVVLSLLTLILLAP